MTKDYLIADLQAQIAQLKQEKAALLESCHDQVGDCHEQLEFSQTLNKVSYAIRQSLDLEVILNTTVAEIRSALGVDRVIICQFDLSQGQGTIVAEAVLSPDFSILGQTVSDPCIHPAFLERCGEGKIKGNCGSSPGRAPSPLATGNFWNNYRSAQKCLWPLWIWANLTKFGVFGGESMSSPKGLDSIRTGIIKRFGGSNRDRVIPVPPLPKTQQQLLQRQQSEHLLTSHAEQQRVINRLSQLVLQNNSIEQLTKHATQEIQKILAMPLVEVLELADNQAAFILKASQGWPKYLLNQKVIGMDTDSQAKYAITHNQPVMVEDFPLETRFSGSPLLHNQRVIASLMVPIIGDNKYGVLGVQSPKARIFSPEEVQFVESIANIIAAALDKRQAQLELNHFFDLSRDLFAIVDFSGNFRRVNQSFTKILGYSLKEIHHHSFFELVHPAHQTLAEEKIHYLSLGFDSVTFESPYRCSDGVYRWLQWNMIAAGDNIFYGVGHDIEERKLAEVALRQLNEDLENRVQKRTLELKQINYSLLKEIQERKVAQQRNASIVKALGDIVYERDDQAETINWYGNHQQVLGWEENQSTLNAWFDRIHPHDRPMVLGQLKQARLHQQLFDVEYRVRHYQGHYLWIHDRGVFRENPRYDAYNRILIIGVIKDITAPKRAQEALGESEERFRAIFEQTDVGMAICTLKGKFFRVNQKCSNIFGYVRYDLLQHTLLDLVYSEDQPSIQAAFTSLLQGEITSYTSENRYLNHHQVLIWGRSHLSLIKNSANEPHYFIVVIEDITEAKEAELALKESQHFIQSITDASPNLLSIYDLESDRHIYVNRGVTKILGYTPEEIQS
ncbi:MAG: PAS domain S-box protein, partial [Synechococcaceae cyanobacterium RL_1_2]|nr:PAS domain S-box protein [Synechococcaceae cyanobacterium RL_1_2]